ncbi:hypothetical protein GIB67_013622, partial [Kingdonia uniflora]
MVSIASFVESEKSNRKLMVLVVDDCPIMRTINKSFLDSTNRVFTQLAKNGKEAVDFYKAGAVFDLILMDRDMPILNGIQIIRNPCIHTSNNIERLWKISFSLYLISSLYLIESLWKIEESHLFSNPAQPNPFRDLLSSLPPLKLWIDFLRLWDSIDDPPGLSDEKEELTDTLIGVSLTSDPPGQCGTKKGDGMPQVLGDKVINGSPAEKPKVGSDNKVLGKSLEGGVEGKACVDGLQGLKIDDGEEKGNRELEKDKEE